ncbi:MAG: hypothetical protein JF626_06040 [Polaromonas sp.]|nr:hypothetical protein [Polaromonas sp.]
MDQDFMKSGDRERPFSPAPEQPLLRWIGFLLVLLTLIYASYRVWESRSDRVLPAKTKQAVPATSQPSPPPQTSAQPQPVVPATPAPGNRIVTKCVVNGKTIYSDNACPQGSAGAQVVTKADHNLMTGLSPSQMAAADRIQPVAPLPSASAQAGNLPSSSAVSARHWTSTSNRLMSWLVNHKPDKCKTGSKTKERRIVIVSLHCTALLDMPEIVLLGSVHTETGRCNAGELTRILELIQPDVLFQEISYFKFMEKNDAFHRGKLEIKAIYEYLKHHSVLQIPVDTVDPSSFEQIKFDQVIREVGRTGPELGAVLYQQNYLEHNKGFEYLNSRLSDRTLRQSDFVITKALQKLNDATLSIAYAEWKAYNSKREDAMIANVYEYCRLNNFNKGLFLFGSAHRAGLIAKIQMVKKTQEIRVNWKLDWG